MTHFAPEIDGYVQDMHKHVAHRFAPCQHKVAGIQDTPCDEGVDDAGEPLAEKVGDAALHREQQEPRQHDKQRHRRAAQGGDDAYPKCVATGDDTALFANIIKLAGVLLNHQIAGDNAQQVEGIVAVFYHGVQRCVSMGSTKNIGLL